LISEKEDLKNHDQSLVALIQTDFLTGPG